MNKIWLIMQRELRQRISKPSFWVLTVLVPVVMAALYAIPVIAAQRATEPVTVMVVDETGLFEGGLQSTADVRFQAMPTVSYAEQHRESDADLVLYIPRRETAMPREATLYYRGFNQPSLAVQSTVDRQLQQLLHAAILEDVYGLTPSERISLEGSRINMKTRDVVTGREGLTHVKTVLAVVLAVLMALAMIIFGVQLMRALQEERQNRIAEVVATSVRPLHVVGGKMCGVMLTALLQLLLWTAITIVFIAAIQAAAPDLFDAVREQAAQRSLATKGAVATMQYDTTVTLVDDAVSGLAAINLPLIAVVFLCSFLLGFMLFGGLLATLAAKLDSDADTLQWTLLFCSPLMVVPLLVSLVMRGSKWLLLLPLTAPAAMVAALPFGVAWGTVLLSLLLTALAAAASLALAAYTYRRHIV